MKRCPADQGGCGELVEMLFDSGLCQKCDAAVARGTRAAGGSPRRAARKPVEVEPVEPGSAEPCSKYVKGPERGICATCQATRAAHNAKKKAGGGRRRRVGAGPGSVEMTIEQLRSQYTEEHERCTREASAWLAKLEVLDEVAQALSTCESLAELDAIDRRK
jgi:hypothetical protein